jgi:hypothetical protein
MMTKKAVLFVLPTFFVLTYAKPPVFSESQAHQLEIMNVTVAAFSLVGSLFIVGCYYKLKDIRNFAFHMVMCMAVSDIINAIGNLLGDAGGGNAYYGATNPECNLQSVLTSFGELASILWSTAIAFTLWQAVVRNNPSFGPVGIEKHTLVYHSIIWGITVLFTILPGTTKSYGDTGGWCWIINTRDVDIAWRFVTFYIPLWIVIVFNAYVYAAVYYKLKMNSGDNEDVVARIKYYPLVLVCCWFWASINRLYEVISGTSVFWLAALHILFASSMGFWNALVYGFTPIVRQRLWSAGANNPAHELATRYEEGSHSDPSREVPTSSDHVAVAAT